MALIAACEGRINAVASCENHQTMPHLLNGSGSWLAHAQLP
jgi:hypothetical protein